MIKFGGLDVDWHTAKTEFNHLVDRGELYTLDAHKRTQLYWNQPTLRLDRGWIRVTSTLGRILE